jgi:hypothetical protein
LVPQQNDKAVWINQGPETISILDEVRRCLALPLLS